MPRNCEKFSALFPLKCDLRCLIAAGRINDPDFLGVEEFFKFSPLFGA